ncbi:MAG: hypothetical protein JNN15_16250, partial [Blastocatellia bacterium]|nr:hypothetical protein [Blastocatellia bacterium]
MQYGEQKIFLSRYRKVSTAIIFLLFALILIRGVALTESLAVSNFVPSLVLAAGFTYSLVYLPKYLNFTIEEEKKYVWNVKIRWLLSVLIVFSGVFYIRAFEKLPIFILLLAIFLATNFFFRIWLKKYRYDKQKLKVIAYTATISDTLVLSLIFNIFEIDWLSKLLLCGFSSHIAVQ